MATVRESPTQGSVGLESHFQGGEHDFSLVLGGPLYQLFRKAHLSGDVLQLAYRRVLLIPLIAWLPLLLLSTKGMLLGRAGRVMFFTDLEVHVRFLIALPILILAEMIVHERTTPVVRRFVERRMISDEDMPLFDRAIKSAVRLRNSISMELLLIALVYGLGLWLWGDRVAIGSATWYASPGGRWHLTPAGYWYVFVSIPIIQFVVLRWYWRVFIWYRFLWQVSRIKLQLITTHPDRSAGLGFLGKSVYAFGPLLFAQGTLLAGVVATRVIYLGQNLASFKLQIIGFIALFEFAILVPLVMFTPQMAKAKRKGLAMYGQFAQDYVEGFERKWIRGERDAGEEMMGTGDIQSLADLGNSYGMVKEMTAVPFSLADISRLAMVTAAPFVPLLLTVFSLEELVMRIVKMLF
ncbi:MAG TPA: hypothetical protein VKB38_22925 [Terracidiphilus sp.]|nr:hypothetical protein [Terracidiphilus sp.]